MKRLIRKTILVPLMLLLGLSARAQFTDSSTGLLQAPTAQMQKDGTLMITNNWLNKESLPSSPWGYDTFSYGFSITFWSRVEISYICTIMDGKKRPNPTNRDKIMFNQDRHFAGRFQVLREGDFGRDWVPSVVFGVSDPGTGTGSGEYFSNDVTTSSNGFFNRTYAVASKHFHTAAGEVGAHAGYQYNARKDYSVKGPCGGVAWAPVWLHGLWLLDDLNLIAEYDSRTFNVGLTASVWKNRFEAMFELQDCKWINAGIRYKVVLRQ